MHNYVQTIFSSWLSPAPFPAALFDSSPQQALASLPQAMKLMADFIHKHPTAYPTTSIMTVLVVANYGAQVDTDLSFGACSFQPNPISTNRGKVLFCLVNRPELSLGAHVSTSAALRHLSKVLNFFLPVIFECLKPPHINFKSLDEPWIEYKIHRLCMTMTRYL